MADSNVIVQINQNEKLDYRENIIPHLKKELLELVNKRIVSEKLDANEEYKKYKRHDSILIDGTRGSGKSTAIGFLKEDDELRQKACILPVLDPNQLDPSTKILNVIIDNIFESVEDQQTKRKFDATQETLFQHICRLKSKIDGLTHRISFVKERSLHDMTRITKEERKLDETIHEFAYNVCRFLGKDVLIQPIDDIDMALEFGPQLLETLRKYMQTPRIIPVVALDSGQIYALIKKKYFKPFGYNAKTPLNDIHNQSELTFLKKLPSEYIQKILPPSQRIILPDMLEVYRTHIEHSNGICHRNHEHFKVYFRGHTADGDAITLPFEELLTLMMSIFFGFFDKRKIIDPLDYHVTNYLKNKTFRSFLDDARAVFKALVKEDDNSYRVDTTPIKERFRLYSKSYANDRYDAAAWFWKNYVNLYYENSHYLKDETYTYSINYSTELIKEILIVSSENALSLDRKEKIYYRLFLQDFFIRKTKIFFNEGKIEKIKKLYSIEGYMEFLLRIVFPVKLFELLSDYGEVDEFNLRSLMSLAKDGEANSLLEVYDEKVNAMSKYVSPYSSDKDDYYFGIALEESNVMKYKKWVEFIDYENHYGMIWHHDISLLSPFRMLCFALETKQPENNYDSNMAKHIAKQYIKIENNADKKRLEKISEKIRKEMIIEITNSSDGIIQSLKYTKKYTKEFLRNLTKIQKKEFLFFEALRQYKITQSSIEILFSHEAKKNISTFYAGFVNMLVLTFGNSFGQDINFHNERVERGVLGEHILFPVIVDDIFLRNLVVLCRAYQENKNNLILNFIRSLDKLIDKFGLYDIYFIHTENKNFEILKEYFNFTHMPINELVENIRKTKPNLVDAYEELIESYIRINFSEKIKKGKDSLLDEINKKRNDLKRKKDIYGFKYIIELNLLTLSAGAIRHYDLNFKFE